jgi:[NiFe] hydrogenase diaphorase moiety large subunit
MSTREQEIAAICESRDNERTRLLDILLAIQHRDGHVDDEAIDLVATALSIPRVDVEGVVTFYAFLSREPRGRVTIRLCNDVVDRMHGAVEVAKALEDELGVAFGETTPDGRFTLEYVSCIGLSDQAPAALVNGVMLPRLGPDKAVRSVRALKESEDLGDLRRLLIRDYGDGNNSHDLVRAAVRNNIRLAGEVILQDSSGRAGLEKALAMSPAEVIREIKTSRLRGRGGGGFPTGMKWEFTRAAGGDERYIFCNADEGEPGTFKDRVILTERPDLLFEGMTIGGYAIGARQGILYLRAEYSYLREFLEYVLDRRRTRGFLGRDVAGKQGFDFDIRIQMGAGAYICGEETALLNSCEGLRGSPRTRPPFPAQKGFLERPTSVNNVETLCCVARILEMGSGWFASMGSKGTTGTKLLSISGDCVRPGIYEIEFGTTLREIFSLCGAEDPRAAQVGGPSGRMVGEKDFDRSICYDDLPTGGALMIFGAQQNLLEVVSSFLEFFVHESCGYCTPCRVGNVLLKERIDKIIAGHGEPGDLEYLRDLANTVKAASRCGLGQTSPNPVLSTLDSFRADYEKLLREPQDGRQMGFDLDSALSVARDLTGRVRAPSSGEQVKS